MLLAVRISSDRCTWEVWRALKKLELLSAAPRATITLLSCSPNFPRPTITRSYTHAKHEPILKQYVKVKSRGTNVMIIHVRHTSRLTEQCSNDNKLPSNDVFN